MKKDAIIDIIANDLKEIELLLENFRGDDYIQAPFIDLLQTKYANLAREIELLNFWKADNTISENEEKQNVVSEPTVAEQANEEPKPTIEAPKVAEPIAADPEPVATAEEPVIAQLEPVTEKQEPVIVKQEPLATKQATKTATKASDLTNYGTPVSDIRRAIAIADRFLYQKELFAGNNEQMNATIDAINGMENYDEAELYLFNKFGWDPENATTAAFLKAVHRRFL